MTPPKTPPPAADTANDPISRYTINEANYTWYMGLMAKIQARLGLNVKVHGNKQLLHDGDIFLFNHFVHLETTLPPFIIFEETGAFARTVAHRELFDANARFAKFLSDMGCAPHDHPQLFPLMVAEILRGRKMIIFPEGRLVRDRRVVDEQGNLGIFSDRDQVFRPLHRGGAALGVTLDILKARLRQLDAAHNDAAFASWAQALEIEPAKLRQAIAKPTVLVPATITYYPIRTFDNAMSKLAKLISKGVPRGVLNEMILQGNMLLNRTDMDICLGAGIEVQRDSPRWQTLLLEYGLSRIGTLEKLFDLKEHASGLPEKMLAQLIGSVTDNLRDTYMERLYAGIMVNQSHLAAKLLMELLARGRKVLDKGFFHRAVYLAVKGSQNAVGLHLHRSLTEPEFYRGLLEGNNRGLTLFLETCKQAGLMSWDATTYTLSEKLHDYPDFQQDRLANPALLYANEIAPLPAVREVIENAIEEAATVGERTLARLQFDDELRSYHHRRLFFDKPRFKDINDKESLNDKGNLCGEPFLLVPHAPNGMGVLLVHGFRATPAQLRAFGDKLLRQGYTVLGVRLAGHGTSPWDLHRRTWGEWLESVQRGYRILAGLTGRVAVVGFSTGAALGLYLASEKPAKLAGVVSIAAPLAVQDRNITLVPWVSRLNRLVSTVTGNDGVVPFYANEPDEPDISYRALPVQAVQQLVELMAALPAKLPEIAVPTLVMQGDRDPVVSPESARKIFDLLTAPQKSLQIVEANRHGILHEDLGPTQALVLAFLKKLQDA